MKRAVTLLTVLLLLTLSSCGLAQSTAERVAEKAMPSLVEIHAEFQASGANATGIVIDDRGHVITNAHVVTSSIGKRHYEANVITGKFSGSIETYPMEIVAYDTECDMAVLRIVGAPSLTPINLSTDELSYGQRVFAIGNGEGYGLGITEGIISAPRRSLNNELNGYVAEYIQTDAAVSSGMSGGALLDERGYAVGMMTFKVKNSYSTVEGMNFAIPTYRFVEYYKEVMESSI